MKKPFKKYCIWKVQCFDLQGKWSRLIGWGDIKARSDKEAQSKVDRKMRSGQFEGYAFLAVLEGDTP